MSLAYDAILLLAFGGPDSAGEIRPFLARVLQGVQVPPSRIEEVAHHYEAVGGRSPLTELTFRQARALEKELRDREPALPVYIGLRHSKPYVRETLEKMATDHIRRALGFILSPHRTEVSWERYQANVSAARAELSGRGPEIDYCRSWHAEPLFVQAWSELVSAQLEKVELERRKAVPVVFTAHSVPVAMAECSPYVAQVHETASLVAARLDLNRWSIAYQSRSGNPRDAWLEPDILSVIRGLRARGVAEMVVAPVGFVCDHVEVLYDLDIEARKVAENLGLQFYRARCVNDHPLFIRMMADLIEAAIKWTWKGKE